MVPKIKILIGVLAILIIGVILFGGWWIWKGKEFGQKVEIKGILEVAETSFFNKECLDKDLKVGDYYLKGICKKSYLVASLSEIIGKEVEIKGKGEKVALADKTLKVIEVEEIIPPEVVIIAPEKYQYQPGEKITLHFKHYLKENVFSYFNTEEPTCSIKFIEKKDGDWKELSTWSQPAGCDQITLKEIKPYHLSGGFGTLEWQSGLEAGEYKLRIIYKIANDNNWRESYSEEFIVLKPNQASECEVKRGYNSEAEKEFHKTVMFDVEWTNYKNFLVKKIEMKYGYGPSPIFDEGPLSQKLIARNGEILKTFKISDPREEIISCEMGGQCPPSSFLKEDKQLIIQSLAFYLGKEFVDANNIRFIEWYEREKLPDWVLPGEISFPDFKPGELLLRIDLSECMKKFCEEVAIENDPSCTGEYYSPSTIIKGKITDYQGNPVNKALIDFSEKLTEGCVGSSYTDENGNFIIDKCSSDTKLKEGIYSMWIIPGAKSNLKKEFREIQLKKGEKKVVNVGLKQCGSIAGKIIDTQGNPLIEAWVYEIGFETPRYHVWEDGAFIIPDLDPGNYRVGAEVKIGQNYIELPSKEAKVELGKTTTINFVFEK